MMRPRVLDPSPTMPHPTNIYTYIYYIYIYIAYICMCMILRLGQQLSLAKISRRQPHQSSLVPICENRSYLDRPVLPNRPNKGIEHVAKIQRLRGHMTGKYKVAYLQTKHSTSLDSGLEGLRRIAADPKRSTPPAFKPQDYLQYDTILDQLCVLIIALRY